MHARAARQGSAKHEADKGREGQGGVQGDEDCFHSVDGGFGEKQAKPGLTEFSGVWAYNPVYASAESVRTAIDDIPHPPGCPSPDELQRMAEALAQITHHADPRALAAFAEQAA